MSVAAANRDSGYYGQSPIIPRDPRGDPPPPYRAVEGEGMEVEEVEADEEVRGASKRCKMSR